MASKDNDGIVIVGAVPHPLRDLYHRLLTMPWWGALGVIATAFLTINALFALGYVLTDGIGGTEAHVSFVDAFFFSAQTLATIGYGVMHPTTRAANVLVVVESVVSTLFTAVATGLVFAKFSQSSEVVVFSEHPCISPMDGQPTLFLRVGNDREGAIMDAQIRVAHVHTHRSAEGVLFYRMHDLVLVRDRTPALARTWTIMHVIDETSPFHEQTPASLEENEVELIVSVVGTDGSSLQPVHGRRRYTAADILWGARHADVLRERTDGILELDVRRFHEIVPTERTEAFPYPAAKD